MVIKPRQIRGKLKLIQEEDKIEEQIAAIDTEIDIIDRVAEQEEVCDIEHVGFEEAGEIMLGSFRNSGGNSETLVILSDMRRKAIQK